MPPQRSPRRRGRGTLAWAAAAAALLAGATACGPPAPKPGRTAAGASRPRVTRRGIQVTLGVLWITDALLQLQPAMFTRDFASQVLAGAGRGQPGFVAAPLDEAARVVLHQPVLINLGLVLIQLAIGAGTLLPRTARPALAASVAWALSVWYWGEGLGGLFGGGATLLTGAPGPVLMYAVLALIAWPLPGDWRPARWAAVAWAALWLGGAVLQLLPGADTNASVSTSLAMNASGEPGWLAAIDQHLAAAVPSAGVSIVADLVVLQVLIGVGALMAAAGARRAAASAGIALSLAYWVTGQDMGQLWSGMRTDLNTAPLVVLLGVAVIGAAPWRQPSAAMRPDDPPGGEPGDTSRAQATT